MKILITLLFKNSALWIQRFLSCLDDLLLENSEIIFDLSILYGTSSDGTEKILKNYVKLLKEDKLSTCRNINNIFLRLLDLPKRLDSLEKLSVLRNVSIYMMDNDNLKNYDYILQIDTDTIFDTGVIRKLIENINNTNLLNIGIISPMIYIEKSHPESENIFYDTFAFRYFNGQNKDGETFKIREPYFPCYKKKETNLCEVYSVGTFYICRSDIFWKYNVIYQTELRKNRNVHQHRSLESEQVIFCRNVRKKTPYKIYVDKDLSIYHVDLPKYGMNWH